MEKFFIFLALLGAVSSIPLASEPMDDVIDLARFGDTIYGDPDEKVGKMVDEWSPDNQINPEELGNYLEGDILIPHDDSRSGLVKESTHWPGAVVPFMFDSSVPSNDRDIINRCFNEYHTKTCIRFVPRTSERDYVVIKNSNTGCWSPVGRIGGRQELNLQSGGCTSRIGTPCHELMHTLGFLHEQSRADRDQYVQIVSQNIKPETLGNFEKASASSTSTYNVQYDISSVMHYSSKAFSRNGRETIRSLHGDGSVMGQREGFSEADLAKLNLRYCQNSEANNRYPPGYPGGPYPQPGPYPQQPGPYPQQPGPYPPQGPYGGYPPHPNELGPYPPPGQFGGIPPQGFPGPYPQGPPGPPPPGPFGGPFGRPNRPNRPFRPLANLLG